METEEEPIAAGEIDPHNEGAKRNLAKFGIHVGDMLMVEVKSIVPVEKGPWRVTDIIKSPPDGTDRALLVNDSGDSSIYFSIRIGDLENGAIQITHAPSANITSALRRIIAAFWKKL